jgi:hypothetical protein
MVEYVSLLTLPPTQICLYVAFKTCAHAPCFPMLDDPLPHISVSGYSSSFTRVDRYASKRIRKIRMSFHLGHIFVTYYLGHIFVK